MGVAKRREGGAKRFFRELSYRKRFNHFRSFNDTSYAIREREHFINHAAMLTETL